MHVMFPPLAEDAVEQLIELRKELRMTESKSHRRRMGAHRHKALSQYRYSRWYTWTSEQRKRFKALFPSKPVDNALIGWFLELDKVDGFLDLMTYWFNKPMAGTVVSYALTDASIWLNDERIDVPKGTGIGFNLSVLHEIKPQMNDQLWACVMVLGNPKKHLPV